MKKIRSVAFMTVFNVALQVSSVGMAGMAFARGGISGGGGNVITDHPVVNQLDPESVEHDVKRSRYFVISYLQNLKGDTGSARSAQDAQLLQKAFSGPLDILTVSQEIDAEVQDDSPCYDRSGNAVDGSVVSVEPDSICISAMTIAKKVNSSEVFAQSAALMIHEYSELAGFNEDEAVAIQKIALKDLATP